MGTANQSAVPITFGSLFAGIGGVDLGLERAGMQCRWQVEVDPFCQDILAKHWFGVKRYGDIRQLTGTELEAVDVVCGGFPCQDLSVAGKRTGIEGSRSGLWFEYARLLGVLRPRFVLIENVSGLLVHDAMRRVVGELARLGYVGIWRSFRASDFGASHLRKRIFIVAHSGVERCGKAGQLQHRKAAMPCRISDELAYSQSRRRGELWEPSGSDGLADGGGEDVAHAASSRRDGAKGQERRLFGSPLQAARSGNGRGDLVNSIGTRRAASGIGCDKHSGSESQEGCGSVADASDGQLQEPWRGSERRDGVGPAGPDVLSNASGERLPDAQQEPGCTILSRAQKYLERGTLLSPGFSTGGVQ
jgi:DNA (cytosine-5)-methyltransferase 1